MKYSFDFNCLVEERSIWQEWRTVEYGTLPLKTLRSYTDRSKTNQGTGTGVAGPSTSYYESMGIFLSSFQAELHAIDIEWGVEWNLDRKNSGQNIVIITYSQAAIRALRSLVINTTMVWECLSKLNDLRRRNRVTLLWIPGHASLERNEKADKLAWGNEQPIYLLALNLSVAWEMCPSRGKSDRS